MRRLAFNGGDALFSIGTDYEIIHPSLGGYAEAVEPILHNWRPHAIVLFGDERPLHRAIRALAEPLGIPVWCFEEGYIRPDYVTFELGGNNANSRLLESFDPAAPAAESPGAVPKLPNATRRMSAAAVLYFTTLHATRFLFPNYRHHRERALFAEVRYWVRSLYRRARSYNRDLAVAKRMETDNQSSFFIVALQIHDDMQLLRHGRGWTTRRFLTMVLDSFQRAAPPDCRLVVKAHPLGIGYGHFRKNLRFLVEKRRLGDRVIYLQSGPFGPLARHARGVVTINSTAGLAAIKDGVPVIAFGDALYHAPGLSPKPNGPEDLDRFWSNPPPVDLEMTRRFSAHIKAGTLIPGSFYLHSTWPSLAETVCRRLKASLPAASRAAARDVETAEDDERPRHVPRRPPALLDVHDQPLSRIGVFSPGVWRLRPAVVALTGADVVRVRPWGRDDCNAILGWGHRQTAQKARDFADSRAIPYLAMEDGFLRSVRPGPAERSIGWVVDRTGIYYDTSAPSDLRAAVLRRIAAPDEENARAAGSLAALRELRLSKYNHAPMLTSEALGLPRGSDIALVVDQTRGDASVSGAGADEATFRHMLDCAIAENPGRTVAVKIHPEALSGRKAGHLAAYAAERGVVLIDKDVNPWALIERSARVYAVSSQFGLEAMLAGVPVTCFGRAAYAGWGLTDDRFADSGPALPRATRDAFGAAAYLDYCRWLDPYDGREIAFEAAVDRLAFLRDQFHGGRRSICVGFSPWRRRAAAPFLDGVAGPPLYARDLAQARAMAKGADSQIIVWGGDNPATGDGAPVLRAEDGFLRSVGLGADFVLPASLVFDSAGVYFDPRGPSDFERLAEATDFTPELLERAQSLRQTLVRRRLSKYNDAHERPVAFKADKVKILVPGQVEDDASVRLGSPEVRSNLELLKRVRARHPDAMIVYKPHPDVEAGIRRGRIPRQEAMQYADHVIADVAITTLLAQVDRVETMTSLAGFEALLRGVPVTAHGLPFYAGWGLTEDLLPCPRRARRLELDELVAAALILYPRYVDRETGLPCPVEVVVERLTRQRARPPSLAGSLSLAVRRNFARFYRHLLHR